MATDNYHLQSDSLAVDAGDTSYGTDVSIPPGVGTSTIDMGFTGDPMGLLMQRFHNLRRRGKTTKLILSLILTVSIIVFGHMDAARTDSAII